MPARTKDARRTLAERLAALDWEALEASLWDRGYARTVPVLTADECRALAALYADDTRFRHRVDMARHRFGLGEYKYFASPLPGVVAELRQHGGAWRAGDLHHARAPGGGEPRLLPRQRAPWGEPGPLRETAGAGDHLP